MSCATVNIQCDNYQNFGCVYIGATKLFTGQFVNQETGNGIDIGGITVSLVIVFEDKIILEKRFLFESNKIDPYSISNGLWEIMLDINDTEKLEINKKYTIEFQISDAGATPEEKIIIGTGCIVTQARLHAL